MGGSSSYVPDSHGGGGGGSREKCGGTFKFIVAIINGTEEDVWNAIDEGEEIYLELIDDVLPRLEVKREDDDFVIGITPPSLGHLIDCIKAGWSYEGKVDNKTGDDVSPEIYVSIKGER